MEEVNDAKDEQSLKAERVQIWEQVVEASRSFFRRLFDLFQWIEIKARQAKDLVSSREQMKR